MLTASSGNLRLVSSICQDTGVTVHRDAPDHYASLPYLYTALARDVEILNGFTC